jgi:predicted ATPase/DNA-binding winged helix-turn-helix (wHTH) protein
MSIGSGSKSRGWRFTDGTRVFGLYPERRQLFNGDNEVSLGQRPFDLLVFLVERAGRVAGKNEILQSVWQSTVASDSTVSTQVAVLRNVIGGNCIATINNQGYQFTLEVEPVSAPLPSPQLLPPSVSLPHPSGTGVGRAAELAELEAYFTEHRAVTTVGPGGVGKTWLAIELGWRLSERFPGGVHLVDFGPVRDPVAVGGTVAQVLGVALRGGDDPTRILATVINKQRMLLIFDSCEYVAEPVRDLVKGLLALAPNLSILATSQEILGLSKEVVFRLEPLPAKDAVALFVDCVRAADHRFRHNETNAWTVAEICRRLDGIPLALEMAAALVPTLGLERVRAGLDHQRFKMLDSRPRIADEARQSTLSAVVDWSYGLLDERDREVFRRLACFSGSFSSDAASAVAWADGTSEWDVAATLGRLVDKSLLVFTDGKQPRYRQLETLHLHGAAKLKESGERELIAERHARFYTELFERADHAWETTPDAEWLAQYGPDIDNIRAALDWAMPDPQRVPIAMTLAGAAGHLWDRFALTAEGRRCLDRLVDQIGTETPLADAARVLRRAAVLRRRTDRLRAVELFKRSIVLYRQLGDDLNVASVLGLIGGDYVYLGRYAEAKTMLEEARPILSASNRTKSLWNVTNELGSLALLTNKFEDARHYYTTARDLARALRDSLRENLCLTNLGEVEFRLGAIERAVTYAHDATAGLRATNQRSYLGPALVNLASYQIVRSDFNEGQQYAEEALSLLREEGGYWLRLCLQLFALLRAYDGRYADAAQLIGFIDAGYSCYGEVRQPLEQHIYDQLSTLLTRNLKPDDVKIWAADGARWSEQRAVEFVLNTLSVLQPRKAAS